MSTVQVVDIKIKDLVPYDNNPRNNKAAIPAVMKSIQEFGFLVPCVVDANNVLVAGHTRWAAAKKLKMKTVPCVVVTELNQEQIDAFRIIDNKTAELSSWDMDLLASEVSQLADIGVDFTSFGFTDADINDLCELENSLVVLVEDEIAHVNKTPKSVKVSIGDIHFFVDIGDYREWANEVKKKNNYDSQATIDDLADRLGLVTKQVTGVKKKKRVR